MFNLTLLADYLTVENSLDVHQDERGLYFPFNCGAGTVDCQIALTTNSVGSDDNDEEMPEDVPPLLLIQLWFIRKPGDPFTLGKMTKRDNNHLRKIDERLIWSRLELIKEGRSTSPVLQRVELLIPDEDSFEKDFVRIKDILGYMLSEAENSFLSIMALSTRQRKWYGHPFLEDPSPTLSLH